MQPEFAGAPDAFAERLGTALAGTIELERELEGGGTSRVFVAHETRLGRRIAVKIFNPDVGTTFSTERFEREVRFAARLQHPHVVPLLSAGHVDGLPYYTMPFIEGESLRHRLTRHGALPVGEVVRILRDLAEALAYAHAEGIVHRDLKPANVLLSRGHAVVADFGVAKAIAVATQDGTGRARMASSSSATTGSASNTSNTAVGIAVGTPAYMALEQVAADPALDQRADLYALGLIAYESLTGAHPFAGYAARAMLAAQLTESPPDVSERRADVPRPLAALVMQLMAKDPDARPRGAATVLQELDRMAIDATGTAAPAREHRNGRRRLALAAAAVLLVGVVAYAVAHRSRARDTAAAVPRAIAVLPFVNTSGDPRDDYFGDGLTDELANALVHIPGLRLAGRSSSYAFKGKSVAAGEIGRTLGVAALIEGTVRRSGDRVRVTIQLVNATDGTVVWDSAYESHSHDVFAIQDSLTHAATDALAPTLGSRANAATVSASRGTRDAEAYDLYLRGRYYWHERGAANVARSIDYFQRAIARDPTFARAHAGLALAYEVLPVYVPDAADSILPLEAASARRAVTLDSTLADAQTAMGVAAGHDFRFREAETHYRAALAIEPSNEFAHHVLGDMLHDVGRIDEAVAELRLSTRLDPLAKSTGTSLAEALTDARRFRESEEASRRVLAIDSAFPLALRSLGRALVYDGQPDSAARTLERVNRLYPEQRNVRPLLVLAYAAAGRWDDAEAARRRLAATSNDPAAGVLSAYADLVFGSHEPAVRVLMTRVGQRRWFDAFFAPACDPMASVLWTDERFRAALRDVGVSQCPLAPFHLRLHRAGPGG